MAKLNTHSPTYERSYEYCVAVPYNIFFWAYDLVLNN